jgi:hypothetical protein
VPVHDPWRCAFCATPDDRINLERRVAIYAALDIVRSANPVWLPPDWRSR